MSDLADLEVEVIDLASDKLSIPKEKIKRESSFQDDLKADSLDLVELVMGVEEKYGIEVPDEDHETLQTVGDVIEYIKERVNK